MRIFENDGCPFALRVIRVAVGLFFCGLGTYGMLKLNIGLAPWEALNQGFANITGLNFGTISIIISLIVVVADILLKESIGLGTVFDAVLVGVYVDTLNAIDFLPTPDALWAKLLYYVVGMAVVCFGQLCYMSAGLGCGPRDAMLVGVGKRMKRLPIGLVNIIVLACVLLVGFLTKSPIGIGTVLSVVGNGTVMQIIFGIFRFDPRKVENEDLIASLKRLRSRK